MAHAAPAMPNYVRTPDGRLADPDATPDQRTYATFMHLSLFAVHFTGVIVLIALAMWLIKRKDSPFIEDHGKEAVNFQISLFLYSLIAGALIFTIIGMIIGIPLLIAVYVVAIVGSIRAAIAANRGEFFRYPITIRLIA
ncbi:MAG: DUF4870 domain-containing protein [Phycisphaeraceae bacterium]|nr:DUF4870 domain-containing protein [Phycisphaeraceae bacterium]